MKQEWTATISASATSWEGLQIAMVRLGEQAGAVRSFKALPLGFGWSAGYDNSASVNIVYSSPVQARIKALRAEADELEKSL